jgi:uncharacterized membrane protein
LSHGNDRAPATRGEAGTRPESVRKRLRLRHPRSVSETSQAPGSGAVEGPGGDDPASVDDRLERHRDSAAGGARGQVADSVTIQTDQVKIARSWQAPLPQPDDLALYEQIVPGAALRILAMAEAVVAGPVENAAKLTQAEIDASRRGLRFAMGLTASLSAAAVVFFALGIAGVGNTGACITAGSVCLSIPVVMLIRSFITRS